MQSNRIICTYQNNKICKIDSDQNWTLIIILCFYYILHANIIIKNTIKCYMYKYIKIKIFFMLKFHMYSSYFVFIVYIYKFFGIDFCKHLKYSYINII